MNFDIKVNGTKIAANLKKQSEQIKANIDKAIYEAAIEGRRMILDRTKRGISLDGKGFEPYSQAYKFYRQKKGRGIKPNLMFRGTMLGAITTIKKRGYSLIKFTRVEEAQKAAWNQEKRPFFGLTDREKKQLTKFVRGRV